MVSAQSIGKLEKLLMDFPVKWDGRGAILDMKMAGYSHWKQMEWIGFYFQFLCDTRLSAVMQIPGPKYGRVEFDGFMEIPWDFKVHPIKDSKGRESTKVIVNDRLAIMEAIETYGSAGLILAVGTATYNDQDRSFQLWHKNLKGGLSAYERDRILRDAPSRLRKTEFLLNEIVLVLLDSEMVRRSSSFQKGFRNSNGNLRKEKVLLDLSAIDSKRVIKFS